MSRSRWVDTIHTALHLQLCFQDWEDFIYIDSAVVSSAVVWLLNYQGQDGSWQEAGHHNSTSPHPAITAGPALTAHVLLGIPKSSLPQY